MLILVNRRLTMIQRIIQSRLLYLSEIFQVVTLTGPRQSGKTTLVKFVFPDLPYQSLEQPDIRLFALTDPRGFLSNFRKGAILDEIQNTPELFSYIQEIVDNDPTKKFILTGSSNFLLMEKVTQTLAGRTAILHLLPLSLNEITKSNRFFNNYEEYIYSGQYPRVFDRRISPKDFYPSYLQTYVERDVRLIKNISDLNLFSNFVRLCAGRTGQILNYSSLASDAGVSLNTAKSWISILESSFVLYRLLPFHTNFSKRYIKSPKIYFHDTGLVCSLLGIRESSQISNHYLKGALFENLMLNEIIKANFNKGENYYPHYWRDSNSNEIDCLMERDSLLLPIEMKAAKTISLHFLDNITKWKKLTNNANLNGYVIYGGDSDITTSKGKFISWKNIDTILE